MSIKIISKLVNYIQGKLNVNEEDIIVNNITVENNCKYKISVNIKNEVYDIRHFEPLQIIQDVKYGMGPYYECCKFVKEHNHWVII